MDLVTTILLCAAGAVALGVLVWVYAGGHDGPKDAAPAPRETSRPRCETCPSWRPMRGRPDGYCPVTGKIEEPHDVCMKHPEIVALRARREEHTL